MDVAVAEENVAAEFVMIVSGRFAVGRKHELSGVLRQRVHLRVRHERLAGAVREFASHVKCVADLPVCEGLRVRQRLVLAARTDEETGAGGVTRDQQAQRRLQEYFAAERGEQLGELATMLLFDYIAEEIGPFFYNKGLDDANRRVVDEVGFDL